MHFGQSIPGDQWNFWKNLYHKYLKYRFYLFLPIFILKEDSAKVLQEFSKISGTKLRNLTLWIALFLGLRAFQLRKKPKFCKYKERISFFLGQSDRSKQINNAGHGFTLHGTLLSHIFLVN